MKEKEIDNHQLAKRYFEGRITPSEEEILFRFVNDAPSNKRMFRQWEEEWMLSYKLVPEVSDEWKQLQRRMQVRQSLNGVFSTKHRQLQRFIAVAAIACLLLLGGTYGLYLYRNAEFAENLFALETEDAYYIAYFNYDEGVKSGELTLQDLGITPEKVSGGIECWSGNNVQIQEGKLSYNLPKHQAEIYHLYKK